MNPQSVVAPVVLLAATVCASLGHAQTVARTYADSRGTKVSFPLGDASFADEVVDFKIGVPPPSAATRGRWSDSALALGAPDYISENADKRKPTALTLGCGGTLIVRLADNALVDVPGPDLYVFEVGPAIEATSLSISPDGKRWIPVGNIGGGTAQVDVSKAVVPGLGAPDYNMKLSRARADAVRAFLQSLPALKGRLITAAGFGETRPIAPNDTEEGRGKNRRVQIAIVPRSQV